MPTPVVDHRLNPADRSVHALHRLAQLCVSPVSELKARQERRIRSPRMLDERVLMCDVAYARPVPEEPRGLL
jgi:hypothetical protein